MHNPGYMTEKAQSVFHFLPEKWATPADVSKVTGITAPQCQMILTQLALAGMAEDFKGRGQKFRRCG